MFLLVGFIAIPYLQNKITFAPTKLDSNYDYDLAAHENIMKTTINENITLKEHTTKSINLIHLHNPESTSYIIYFHGNAGNIQTNINVLYDLGHKSSVILFDYSGYGKSTGNPTITRVCENAYDIWLFTTQKLKINPNNIILYGVSLGGAIASYLAHMLYKKNKKLCKAIILQSSFTSSLDLAKDILPELIYLFAKFFINDTFNSIKYLQKLNNHIKIMIAHSKKDEIVNFKHSKLFNKKLSCSNVINIIIGGTHNKPEYTPEFWKIFNSYL